MNTKIMCWNCQGADHPCFHNMIKEYHKEFSPDILCLLKTRISGTRVIGIIAKLSFCNSFKVEANGFAGGI